MNVGRRLSGSDFAIHVEPDRQTASAALLLPFHWDQDFITTELRVENGVVSRDTARKITKFAVIDRYAGDGKLAAMFWLGCGPADPQTALACSVAHDSHNVWCVGSSDEAMAMAVNRLEQIGGGWVLVHHGRIAGEVHFEIGGLMTARPAEALDAEMAEFRKAADQVDWMYEPSVNKNWEPGFPEHLIFATLTCAPWRWVLVAPHEKAPEGFVNVQTGETHPVVW
jgi:adenine deaminase